MLKCFTSNAYRIKAKGECVKFDVKLII